MQLRDTRDQESIRDSAVREQRRDPASLAPDYEVRPLNPDRVAALAEHCRGTLLDVGCGNGAYVDAAGEFAVGLDLAAGDRWAESTGRFVIGSALALPFRDGSFDTVCSFETLEHVADPMRALKELKRVARQRVIVSVPNCEITDGMRRSNLIYHHWIDPTHVNFFGRASLSALLDDAGLSRTLVTPINRIDTTPFLREALRLPGSGRRLTARVARRISRKYHMTLLAVGDA